MKTQHCLSVILAVALTTLAMSCSKGQDTPGGGDEPEKPVVSDTVKAVMTACFEPICGTELTWDRGDEVILRFANASYGSRNSSDTLRASSAGREISMEGKMKYVENQFLYVFRSPEGAFSSASGVSYATCIPASQTGRKESIKDNAIFYRTINRAEIRKTSECLQFSAAMTPFFALLKLNLPSSLGVTSISINADAPIAGKLTINPSRTYGTIRGKDSSYFLDRYDKSGNVSSITVSRAGEIIDGDVFVIVAPDGYDPSKKEYLSSATTLEFKFENSSGAEAVLEKRIEGGILCRSLTDIGTVSENLKFKTKDPVQFSLRMIDGHFIPHVVLDSAATAQAIAGGARFHYLTSREGFDVIGEPRPGDAELTSSGITLPIQNKGDVLYLKMVGTQEGKADTYLKAVVRNWKFDVNFIAPDGQTGEYEGLTMNFSPFSTDKPCDSRIQYSGFGKGSAVVSPLLGGEGWAYAGFFGGSFASTFSILNGSNQIYSQTMAAKEYFYESNPFRKAIKTGTLNTASAVTFQWSYKIWLMHFALLEQMNYIPENPGAGSGTGKVEDFEL